MRFNSTKLNRLRNRSLEINDDNDETSRRKSLRTIKNDPNPEKFPKKCFFYFGDESDKQILHAVTTFEVDRRVQKIATETNDSATLAKLSQGDMIAIEACYHAKCLSSYYNKTRAKARETGHTPNSVVYGVALVEIVAFLQEQRLESHTTVFKLADLIKMYCNRL